MYHHVVPPLPLARRQLAPANQVVAAVGTRSTMEPVNTLYANFLLLGAAHGLFLAVALVNVKSGNALAHRLLALLTLAFAADLGVDYLMRTRYLLLFPKLILVEAVTNFLYGPLTYLYVRVLTSAKEFRFSGKTWAHFLPFAVSILLVIPFFLQSDSQVIAQIYDDAGVDNLGLWVLGLLLVEIAPIPVIGVYIWLSVKLTYRHSRIIREQFSFIERISLKWLRNLLIALGTLYALYVFAIFFADSLGVGEPAESALSLMMVIVIYTMGYMGIRQPAIFGHGESRTTLDIEPTDAQASSPAQSAPKKYQKSALDADMSSALLHELQRHMANEKSYLDSTLTLAQLAAQLQISPNYLSQVINEQTGSNFFDYINQHRVAAAKERLRESTQSSILSIAMDAGFNSKSAFYTAFKQHTDMTPSQFRKSAVTTSIPRA